MTRVEVRHRAKVPIVTTDTKLGFEADVAVGGHNGADTSQFAASQVAKYQSFGPVVLLLKIILAQQDLDKPFTGGLGSFKLYVLVSHHVSFWILQCISNIARTTSLTPLLIVGSWNAICH
jgi:DNA polymerase sigma